MSEAAESRLPPELWLVVFSSMTVPDILRCTLVSRRMHDIIRDSAEIQYKIELFCSFHRDRNDPNLAKISFSDRLQALQRRENNWTNLRFSRHSCLGYPLSTSYVYEISGGKLILGGDIDHIANPFNGTSTLNIHDLPVHSNLNTKMSMDSLPCRSLRLQPPIADFALDISQNLLILARRSSGIPHGISLYIHAFDSNIPHPEASKHVLEVPNQAWAIIYVTGSVLACLFADPGAGSLETIIVWNWRTGDMLGQIPNRKQKYFTLVSSTCFVVANLEQETLDVYTINLEEKSVELLQKLALPRISGDEDNHPWTYDNALLRSYPNPISASQRNSKREGLDGDLPFTTDEEDGIISCSFYCGGAGIGFTLIVHRSSISHVYNEAEEPRTFKRHGKEVRERLIPWSDWGPLNTRWINVETSQRWICYVHGHRIAVLSSRRGDEDLEELDVGNEGEQPGDHHEENWLQAGIERLTIAREDSQPVLSLDDLLQEEGINGFYYLRVFDFNPHNVRRAELSGKMEAMPNEKTTKPICGRPVLVKEPSIFRDKTITRLPYVETTARLADLGLEGNLDQIEGVMLNEDSVLIMMAHTSRTDGVEVLTV